MTIFKNEPRFEYVLYLVFDDINSLFLKFFSVVLLDLSMPVLDGV